MKDFVKLFKQYLDEASELFGRDPSVVTETQWRFVAKGKQNGVQSITRLIGFATIRSFVAPTKDVSRLEQKAIKDLITRLIQNA